MIAEISLLVSLVELVDQLPLPPAPTKRGRGRPVVYHDRLFLKALVVMIVKGLHTINELRSVLEQPTAEMQHLHQLFTVAGRYPSRRTWERRLAAIPLELSEQIALGGQWLVELLRPFENTGPAVALDSTLLAAKGAVWHQKDRAQGRVPHSGIDTEAAWSKSGWHGWVYGYKLHLAITVAEQWIPLGAYLTPANTADDLAALPLIAHLPHSVRYVLGDTHYNRRRVRQECNHSQRYLVATRTGKRPHRDGGAAVRKVFHQLRSHSIENFNEQFKTILPPTCPCRSKGYGRRWAGLWAASWFINWLCCIVIGLVNPCGSVSKPFSRLLDHSFMTMPQLYKPAMLRLEYRHQ